MHTLTTLGDFRKYPYIMYHTTGSILNSEGEGSFLDWKSESMGRGEGGRGVTQFGIPNSWGGFSSEFQRGKTEKALPDQGSRIKDDQAGVNDHVDE